MSENTLRIRVGHSPDPDDAFMFYALAKGKIPTGRYRFEHELVDIETLNRRAFSGQLELTAVSVHAYGLLTDRYVLCTCGASMGDRYGPMVVAPRKFIPLKPIPLQSMVLNVTNQCNLACTYCYEYGEDKIVDTPVEVDLPVDLFADQMAALVAETEVVTLSDGLARLADRSAPRVPMVAVTFDDGTADFTEVALPVMVSSNGEALHVFAILGGRLRRGFLLKMLDDLLELTMIQPDPVAARALIDKYAGALIGNEANPDEILPG